MAVKVNKEQEEAKVEMKTEEASWTEDKVTIKLPKEAKGEANYVIASCNGVVYKIKKGVEVEVPRAIAEILQHAEEAREEADNYSEQVEN